MSEPTDAEIEAGARALAAMHFIDGPSQDLSRFSDSQQQVFRDKARAVIEAVRDIKSDQDYPGLVDKLSKSRSRTLMAAKIFARLFMEFDGKLQLCQVALNELLDTADQLETLESLNTRYDANE